ncbi:MAG: thioredoxin domain-containing protein [Pirellulaceae bacterium]
MPNRLSDSSSPYLRQHQDNPVDWYPWGDEAFERARTEDKPIFLSVGYSACHWCHVMEHESFENEQLAAILNANFVAIKVDREERPDVDQIYMQAVQMLTGSGGWPMSVFMTADGTPFYGGTYWPPDSRWGRPGFGQVLMAVADAWHNRRAEITQQGQQIAEHLQEACRGPRPTNETLDPQWIDDADRWLIRNHDPTHGGFGAAPKFPHAMDLSLLLELEALRPNAARCDAIRITLDKMSRGGIYDHLAGGFARYSVDEKWLVPHFEKMLYDNALLASVYADAFRLWAHEEYAQVVRETLDYVIREMTNEQGGYHSTEDADSEGVEGKFYVWSRDEVLEVLGPERGERFCDCYDVTTAGNFEESNILNLPKSIEQFASLRNLDPNQLASELQADRQRLLERRAQRVRPGLDDKVLLSWNALMITAMTRGYRALGDRRYLNSARQAVDFICKHMRRGDGRLWHTWRHGKATLNAYLDDLSYLVDALVELFQVDSHAQYLKLANEVAEQMLSSFRDPAGGFFFTADDHEPLIARSKDLADSSVPSGNAMAATGLLALGRLTGRDDFLEASESALRAASRMMSDSPGAAGQSLRALLRFQQPPRELVLLGDDNSMGANILKRFEPHALTLVVSDATVAEQLQELCPLLQQRAAVDGKSTLYVCEGGVCQTPLVGRELMDFVQ